MTLTPDLRARFRAGAEKIYGNDRFFSNRLEAFFPLIGLRWVLIMLNEFRPEYWRRRQLAGYFGDYREVRRRQLDRARELLLKLEASIDLAQYCQLS
jgi:hypothetical protein